MWLACRSWHRVDVDLLVVTGGQHAQQARGSARAGHLDVQPELGDRGADLRVQGRDLRVRFDHDPLGGYAPRAVAQELEAAVAHARPAARPHVDRSAEPARPAVRRGELLEERDRCALPHDHQRDRECSGVRARLGRAGAEDEIKRDVLAGRTGRCRPSTARGPAPRTRHGSPVQASCRPGAVEQGPGGSRPPRPGGEHHAAGGERRHRGPRPRSGWCRRAAPPAGRSARDVRRHSSSEPVGHGVAPYRSARVRRSAGQPVGLAALRGPRRDRGGIQGGGAQRRGVRRAGVDRHRLGAGIGIGQAV